MPSVIVTTFTTFVTPDNYKVITVLFRLNKISTVFISYFNTIRVLTNFHWKSSYWDHRQTKIQTSGTRLQWFHKTGYKLALSFMLTSKIIK